MTAMFLVALAIRALLPRRGAGRSGAAVGAASAMGVPAAPGSHAG
jgi:hypothetical protein